MKKIVWIGLSVVLAIGLILFFPVPKGSYDDGGSREYEALTYKIIRWNRLTDNGVYHKTRIYWGADKRLPIDELFAREVPFMPTVDDPPIPDTVDFKAQYIRTNGYHADAVYPAVTVIRSKIELNRYYQQYKDLYNLERCADPAADSTIGFLDACDRYDDAYFKENCLILILLEEPSGSIRHTVTAVQQATNGKLTVNMSRITPEIGTDDMAQWHIFVETAAGVADADDITVVFPPKSGMTIPTYAMSVYQNNTAVVAVPLPDGWEDAILDDGIRFWPTGHNGYLQLSYTDFFGVCGTGLQCNTITLGGYEAEQGTYDNHKLWDYIVLPEEWYSVGDYVIYNHGADAWWDEYGEEAMAILNGINIHDKVTTEDNAIVIAKEVCNIEYDSIRAEFDTDRAVWLIDFYTEGFVGGDQLVTVDGFTGKILEIEYGE